METSKELLGRVTVLLYTGHLFSLSSPKRQCWFASIVFKRWRLLLFAGNLRSTGTRKKEVSVCVFQNSGTVRESIFQRSVGFCVCVSLGRLISLFFRGVKSTHSLPEILFPPLFYSEEWRMTSPCEPLWKIHGLLPLQAIMSTSKNTLFHTGASVMVNDKQTAKTASSGWQHFGTGK